MDRSHGNIYQKIARAAHAFEKRRTKHARPWEAVFMNEDTIVIALHGPLTALETALAQCPAGTAVGVPPAAIHKRLRPLFEGSRASPGWKCDDFGNRADDRRVVHVFTTDTVGEIPARSLRNGGPGAEYGPPRRMKVAPHRGHKPEL